MIQMTSPPKTDNNECRHPWVWTPLTILSGLNFIGAWITVAWFHSIGALVYCALTVLWTYWVFMGCARRGEPVANWIVSRMNDLTRT